MLIEPETLPADPAAWEPYVRERVGASLATARGVVERLKDGTQRTTAETLALWNDGDIAIAHASGAAGLLAQVHPDLAVRTAAEDGTLEIARFLTGRALDRELYDVLAGLNADGLDAEAERVLRHTLRDFRRAGVDRDEATRARLAAISERLTELGQDFGRAIRDDVRSIRIIPDRLAGLPQDFIDAHPVDGEGLVTITTDYPDVIPFRTFAHDRTARQELVSAFNNRAWPQNDAVLHEILDLRAEQAGLLDYASWPDYDAEVKMIGSGRAIEAFIDRIADLADAPAQRELAVLLERAQREDAAIDSITTADSAYFVELVRRERFDVDAAAVRGYFDFAAVRAGLLDVTGRLFGITYSARPSAPVWHPDVTAYDVMRDGTTIGRIYLDLHPREGKFKHAAQFDLVSGVSGRHLPEGALVCNFSRGLMEHQDVVTFFHEFGHLIHHVLGGDQQWVRFSGVATEWDFVEAPSQLLEQWAWDAEVLATFARDGEGTPIPADLVARMVEAHEFGKGLQARTQMFYAATSYYLHLERPADHTARVAELQSTYDAYARLPDTHFQASFGHLDGYGSGYYTYMWSLVIAKDLLTAFDPAALLDTRVAGRYRDHVLAPGGSRDAADLVAAFLGRPYSFDAFGAWLAG